MKAIAKLGLIGLAIAASSAHADVFLPSTGNGELTLFVRNDVTGAVYARGLQTRIDSVLSQSAIAAGYTGDTSIGLVQTIDYALPTFGADANLASFLATAGTFTWTIMAGDNSGSNNATPDARRYLTTTTTTWDELNPNSVTNGLLGGSWNNLQQTLITLNGVLDGTEGSGNSTASQGQWRQVGANPGEVMGDWAGAGPNTATALGTAAHLYVLTTAGGGTSGLARTYQGFDVVLNADGSLTAVTTPPIPLPPAVWMLVSGLLTLAGVGRRKAAAAAAV
jgi:hypothetical protein